MRRGAARAALILLTAIAFPAAGAGAIEISAPGGLWYDRDTIGARGTPGKPLVAILDGYEFSAQSLVYDQRKRTGQARGDVRWRERGAGVPREIRADAVDFAMAAKTLHAEGGVSLKDRDIDLSALTLEADLIKGVYELTGSPVRAQFGTQDMAAAEMRYDAAQGLIRAAGTVLWRQQDGNEMRNITAERFEYDLTHRSGNAAGNVTLTSGQYRLTAANLTYGESDDLLTLTGAPVATRGDDLRLTAGSLTWRPALGLLTAAGGAALTSPSVKGTCDEIRFAQKENLVSMLGGARFTRGADVLAGEEIVYDLSTGKVRIEGHATATIAVEG